MRAWGPVAAIVFAFVLAVAAGSRLDATAAAMVVGVVVGTVMTSAVFFVLFALMASHNARVRAERERNLHRVEVTGYGATLARQSEPRAVVVFGPEREGGPFRAA